MSYCTNEECPHRKRTGKPAEFLEGITVCSDCGSVLSNASTIIQEHKEALHDSGIVKRILFTLGILTAWYLLSFIRIPYVDFSGSPLGSAFEELFFGDKMFSITALGIMPYVSAYILTEIAALIIPPLKKWRKGGYEGRRKLRLTALQTTLLIAPLQGLEIATSLESMAEGIFVQNPGLGFRLIVSITLTAATFLAIWLADLITRRGIGHGISILLVSGILIRYANDFRRLPINDLTPFFLLLIPFILIILITKVERSFIKIPVKYNDGITSYIPLRLNAAGVVPLTIGLSLVSMPITVIYMFFDPTIPPAIFAKGKASYFILSILTSAIIYPVFSLLFYNPRKIVAYLREKNATILPPEGIKEEDYIGRNLKLMAFAGALYLCIVALLPDILGFVPGLPIVFGGISLIIMVAVALDILHEIRILRQSNNLVKVYESHNIPIAGLLRNMLMQHDISCYLKGYHHRALLYFFGPHIEISVLVPENKADVANEIITKYFEPVTIASA